MKPRSFLPAALFVALVLVSVGACSSDEAESGPHAGEDEEGEPELALHMTRLQRWTHKATLAMEARNPELADFYLHEMEESIETIQSEAPTYDGYAIADLTERMLVPSVEALDGALDERDWQAVDRRLSQLAQSCNQCHRSTDHGFVRVNLADVPNPYPQDFSREEK